jgi:hypothetical protein
LFELELIVWLAKLFPGCEMERDSSGLSRVRVRRKIFAKMLRKAFAQEKSA